jgi:hypothetical protein
MADVEIRNEEDLFRALDLARMGNWDERQGIAFVGWPNFEIIIRGEHFDGGVPTRIMPGLLELQKVVDRAYADAKYGKATRRLSTEDRAVTELVVRFEAGHSTKFLADLGPQLTEISKQALTKMNGQQVVFAVTAIAALAAGAYSWDSYLQTQVAEKKLDIELRQTQEETKRYEIFREIAEGNEHVRAQVDRVEQFQGALLKRLTPEDALIVDDQVLIDGQDARTVVKNPRRAAVETRLDANFKILSVDSGLVAGGFRLRIRNAETGEEITVSVPEGTLSPEQIQILQDGEWGKKPVLMKLNIRKIGDRIAAATLIEAGLLAGE